VEPLKWEWLHPALDAGFFYFAAVFRGSGEWEEVPQGISTTSRKATKTPSKIPVRLGQSWKASSRHANR